MGLPLIPCVSCPSQGKLRLAAGQRVFAFALCRSPLLESNMFLYHRFFYDIRGRCVQDNRLDDMIVICKAGLKVYGPDRDPHRARSSILWTLGECYEAKFHFRKAVEVSGTTGEPVRSSHPSFLTRARRSGP
jgi:hypothetical protein